MRKRFFAALVAAIFLLGLGRVTQADFLVTPDSPSDATLLLAGNQTSTHLILNIIDNTYNIDTLLYKHNSDAPNSEGGVFEDDYLTLYSGDPNDAEVSWNGADFIPTTMNPLYLLVKDGNAQPYSWYFFNISGWDRTEDLLIQNFWPGEGGAISHISIYSPVPEPATMLLFGTGLFGLAGLARRKAR